MVVARAANAATVGLAVLRRGGNAVDAAGPPVRAGGDLPPRGTWAAAASCSTALRMDRTRFDFRETGAALTAAMFADASGRIVGQEPEGGRPSVFRHGRGARRGSKRWGPAPGTSLSPPRFVLPKRARRVGAHRRDPCRRDGPARRGPGRSAIFTKAAADARGDRSSRRISPRRCGRIARREPPILRGPDRRPRSSRGHPPAGVMSSRPGPVSPLPRTPLTGPIAGGRSWPSRPPRAGGSCSSALAMAGTLRPRGVGGGSALTLHRIAEAERVPSPTHPSTSATRTS